MKVTKLSRTYRIEVSQKELELLLHSLYNSGNEDATCCEEEKDIRDGERKLAMWDQLRKSQ